MTTRTAAAPPPEKLVEMLNQAAIQINKTAITLDMWANQSVSGGWSTHQVEATRKEADKLRRLGAEIRILLEGGLAL